MLGWEPVGTSELCILCSPGRHQHEWAPAGGGEQAFLSKRQVSVKGSDFQYSFPCRVEAERQRLAVRCSF